MAGKTKEELLEHYLNTDDAEFIGLLVHDVRGPLSDIISATKLINSSLDDGDIVKVDDVHTLVKIILASSDKMRMILDTAIEYDRLKRSQKTDTE
ncbi:MAG: hypothetical protein CUN54_01640 [Phototrophicales bacterium]|nr:MAG: hypothetical protein CUN54_01640 [Phototrophicales bacterium]